MVLAGAGSALRDNTQSPVGPRFNHTGADDIGQMGRQGMGEAELDITPLRMGEVGYYLRQMLAGYAVRPRDRMENTRWKTMRCSRAPSPWLY